MDFMLTHRAPPVANFVVRVKSCRIFALALDSKYFSDNIFLEFITIWFVVNTCVELRNNIVEYEFLNRTSKACQNDKDWRPKLMLAASY